MGGGEWVEKGSIERGVNVRVNMRRGERGHVGQIFVESEL